MSRLNEENASYISFMMFYWESFRVEKDKEREREKERETKREREREREREKERERERARERKEDIQKSQIQMELPPKRPSQAVPLQLRCFSGSMSTFKEFVQRRRWEVVGVCSGSELGRRCNPRSVMSLQLDSCINSERETDFVDPLVTPCFSFGGVAPKVMNWDQQNWILVQRWEDGGEGKLHWVVLTGFVNGDRNWYWLLGRSFHPYWWSFCLIPFGKWSEQRFMTYHTRSLIIGNGPSELRRFVSNGSIPGFMHADTAKHLVNAAIGNPFKKGAYIAHRVFLIDW